MNPASSPPKFIQIGDMQPSGIETVALAISMLTIATCAVAARLAIRWRSQNRFDIGDAFITVALVAYAGESATLIWGVQTSGGTLDFTNVPLSDVSNFFKCLFAEMVLFNIVVTSVKLSILCLYTTLFPTRTFLKLAHALMVICVVWSIIFLFVLIFQCTPIHAFWDIGLQMSGKAKCIPFSQSVVGFESTNVAIDVLILSLPIYMIRKLQLSTPRKIACGFIFILGGFVCVICVIRAAYIAGLTHSAGDKRIRRAINWSTVELSVSVICACLPTYAPLLQPIGQGFSRLYCRIAGLVGSKPANLRVQSPGDKRDNSVSEDHFELKSGNHRQTRVTHSQRRYSNDQDRLV